MAISDKTRKTIWARSGNKCSICKANLVGHKTEKENSVIVGEECHIISEKQKGPRYENIPGFNYDSEQNLLLLCANCHKIVDENQAYYTKVRLESVKREHEEFIRIRTEAQDPNNLFPEVDGVTVLPKINSGKELYNILCSAIGMEYDFEDTKDKEENDFIAGIFQDLNDHLDFLSMEAEVGPKVGTVNELNYIIGIIEENGFILFGENRTRKMKFTDNSAGNWNIAVLYLMKNSNPNVIRLGT
jgi:hypothetical protein